MPDARTPAQARHARLWADDLAHVWHPFTQMQGFADDAPLIIERGEGSWLEDTLGRKWLDGISSLWVTVHGHRKRELDEALVAQLSKVAHCTLLGQANVPSIELAKKLAQVAPPGLGHVFYSDNGSTAVEVALKMAYQYWRQVGRPEKRKLGALAEAYHGDTLGSVSVGGIGLFHERFKDLLFEVVRFPSPHAYRWKGQDPKGESLAQVEALLQRHGPELAALVVEPLVQGAAGMWLQPEGWLREVAALCRRHEVLLVCDEVATGFGRTGTLFAVEHEGVVPDLLCVAKGLTGGYLPLAATLASDRVYQAFLGRFDEAKTFFHGHTYTGNPLACAVALRSLQLFEEERTLERMRAPVEVLREGLARLAAHPHVGDVRQRGLMVGVELVQDKAGKVDYPFEARQGFKVCQAARAHGVLLRPLGNVVVLMPPLSLTVDEARLLVEALADSLDRVCGP